LNEKKSRYFVELITFPDQNQACNNGFE